MSTPEQGQARRPRRPTTYETSAVDAIESGAQEIADLADEMRSWYDNMPENFQNSERGERVSEAADTLEDADASSKADALLAAVDACEGESEEPGCPEHVLGTPCAVCAWNGAIVVKPAWPTLEEWTSRGGGGFMNGFIGRIRTWRGHIAIPYVQEHWADSFNARQARINAATPEQIDAALQELRKRWWAEMERTVAAREEYVRRHPAKVPARRVHKPEVPAVPGFVEATSAVKVTLLTAPKRQSRSDRLGAAHASIFAGCEALSACIEAHPEWKDDARIAAVTEALDDISEILAEVEGVEFPGMYG